MTIVPVWPALMFASKINDVREVGMVTVVGLVNTRGGPRSKSVSVGKLRSEKIRFQEPGSRGRADDT